MSRYLRRAAVVVMVVASALAAPAAFADDGPVLGVPAPPEDPPRPVVSLSTATAHANFALADRFPASFLLRDRGRVVCIGEGDGQRFRCIASWRYRRYTFRGRLRVQADDSGAYVTMRVVRTGRGRYATYS